MSKVDELVEIISGMSVKEISEAVKKMEEAFGVSAAAPVMMMQGGAGAEAAEEEEEKTAFTVILKEFGEKKVDVIRQVRALTQLDLREAKNLVEAGNKAVLEDVSKEEAEKAKKMLEEVGAKVEIK